MNDATDWCKLFFGLTAGDETDTRDRQDKHQEKPACSARAFTLLGSMALFVLTTAPALAAPAAPGAFDASAEKLPAERLPIHAHSSQIGESAAQAKAGLSATGLFATADAGADEIYADRFQAAVQIIGLIDLATSELEPVSAGSIGPVVIEPGADFAGQFATNVDDSCLYSYENLPSEIGADEFGLVNIEDFPLDTALEFIVQASCYDSDNELVTTDPVNVLFESENYGQARIDGLQLKFGDNQQTLSVVDGSFERIVNFYCGFDNENSKTIKVLGQADNFTFGKNWGEFVTNDDGTEGNLIYTVPACQSDELGQTNVTATLGDSIVDVTLNYEKIKPRIANMKFNGVLSLPVGPGGLIQKTLACGTQYDFTTAMNVFDGDWEFSLEGVDIPQEFIDIFNPDGSGTYTSSCEPGSTEGFDFDLQYTRTGVTGSNPVEINVSGVLQPQLLFHGVDLTGNSEIDVPNNNGILPNFSWIKDFQANVFVCGENVDTYLTNLGSISGEEDCRLWEFQSSETSSEYSINYFGLDTFSFALGEVDFIKAQATKLGGQAIIDNEVTLTVDCGTAESKDFADNLEDIIIPVVMQYDADNLPEQISLQENTLSYSFSCETGQPGSVTINVTPRLVSQGNEKDLAELTVNFEIEGVAEISAANPTPTD